MPRGRKKVVDGEERIATAEELKTVEAAPVVEAPKVEAPKPALEPLGPGQKYFEAPTGEIVVGDADKDHLLWYDPQQKKRVWINPKR